MSSTATTTSADPEKLQSASRNFSTTGLFLGSGLIQIALMSVDGSPGQKV